MTTGPTMLISIHALLAESDDRQRKRHPHPLDFYPRSPCGERQSERMPPGTAWIFLSTLSLRRATRHYLEGLYQMLISIHALLAESDQGADPCRQKRGISIHALLAESDQTRHCKKLRISNFYPRSPCGERRPATQAAFTRIGFLSTLSLRRAT